MRTSVAKMYKMGEGMSWWCKIDLWKRVIVALILGLACGLGLRYGMGAEAGGTFATNWISWAGDLF